MSPATPTSSVAVTVAVTHGDAENQVGIGEDVVLSDMANLSVGDESPVEIKTESSGLYSGKAKNSEGYSPSSKRYTPPFVRNGGRSRSEDPFQQSSTGKHARSSLLSTPKSSRILADWRSGSSSSGRSGSESPLNAKSQRNRQKSSNETQTELLDSPRSRVAGYTLVKAEDAQAIYPPSCCVFVANLLQSESEEALQMAVTQIFREFGPVFVKIRRDAKQMPFAFCQYTKPEHADLAIREGRGRLVRGRPCRCEKAKAHQFVIDHTPGLFLIERKFGPVITPDEARELLQEFGKIELCYTASHVERTALNLNEGVIIQFEMYDEGQNAHSAFRNHDVFKLQSIAGLGSPARNNQIRSPPSSDNSARAYLARYEVDRRSIFVGNLPAGTTEAQVHDIFEHYGAIEDISIRDTLSKYDPQDKLAFAFVEFKTVVAVGNAIAAKHGFSFGGRSIKVLQKDSESTISRNRPRVYVPAGSTAAYQSPGPRRVEPQFSPMSPISPSVYGSPYGYPYSPYYNYTPPPFVTDGQSYYQTAPYSPAYYSYQGCPSYTSSAPVEAPTGENSQTGYYGYSPYPYAPAPYWSAANPSTEQQTSSPVMYYRPAYSLPMETSNGPDDRSATPTPAGHTPVTDDSVEAQ